MNQFKSSSGWYNGFCARWEDTLRAATNKAQEIPTAFHNLIMNWMRFNRRNSVPRDTQVTYDGGLCFPLRLIANMDQTPLPFEHLRDRTYACKGDKTVWAKSIRGGWDKRQATLVPTIFAAGIPYVKPDIYFKGTDNSAVTFF